MKSLILFLVVFCTCTGVLADGQASKTPRSREIAQQARERQFARLKKPEAGPPVAQKGSRRKAAVLSFFALSTDKAANEGNEKKARFWMDQLERYLIENPEVIDDLNWNGRTALHEEFANTRRNPQLETVKLLLDFKADPNLPSGEDNYTPLMKAVKTVTETETGKKLIKALLDAGAEPAKKVNPRETSVEGEKYVLENALDVARAKEPKKEIFFEMLEKHSSQPRGRIRKSFNREKPSSAHKKPTLSEITSRFAKEAPAIAIKNKTAQRSEREKAQREREKQFARLTKPLD